MKCAYCNDPAYVRCRKHNQTMCGGSYCLDLHRWGGGDCEFIEAGKLDIRDKVIAMVVGTLVLIGLVIKVAL